MDQEQEQLFIKRQLAINKSQLGAQRICEQCDQKAQQDVVRLVEEGLSREARRKNGGYGKFDYLFSSTDAGV